MGEAKRKKRQRKQTSWPREDNFSGTIDLYFYRRCRP